jgi:hypothetical protein
MNPSKATPSKHLIFAVYSYSSLPHGIKLKEALLNSTTDNAIKGVFELTIFNVRRHYYFQISNGTYQKICKYANATQKPRCYTSNNEPKISKKEDQKKRKEKKRGKGKY